MVVRVLGIIVVIFVIYAVVNDPVQAAHFVGNLWDHLKDALSAIGDFFNALIAS